MHSHALRPVFPRERLFTRAKFYFVSWRTCFMKFMNSVSNENWNCNVGRSSSEATPQHCCYARVLSIILLLVFQADSEDLYSEVLEYLLFVWSSQKPWSNYINNNSSKHWKYPHKSLIWINHAWYIIVYNILENTTLTRVFVVSLPRLLFYF